MSQEPLVTEELIARQTPEAQAIIRILLARIEQLETRLNKTPKNSSLPLEHAASTRQTAVRKVEIQEETGRSAGPQET